MTVSSTVPAEHRRRRREACERAAVAFDHAAAVHADAAVFYAGRGDEVRAERERRAAEVDAAAARDAHATALRQ